MDDIYSLEPFPLHYFHGKAPPIVLEEGEFELERIIKHKTDASGNTHFLVKWEGYPLDTDKWEPLLNFFNSTAREYLQDRKMHCKVVPTTPSDETGP